jgi:type I restriction enzyme S subunit
MTMTEMRPKWKTKPLSEVTEIERQAIAPEQIASGTRYVGLEHITNAGGFIGVKEVSNGELASTKFRFGKQHILYGKLRPYLSKIARPDFEGVCSTDILPLLPGKEIDRGFLFYYLRQPHMVELATRRSIGANLPRLSPKQLAQFEIPLPPLSEQKRIADILDRADAIRGRQQEAEAEVAAVINSQFLKVFGDPLRNPRRWPRGTFDDHLTLLQYGPRFYNEAYSADGVRIVRITDLDFQGRLDYSAMPLMSVSKADKERFTLRTGDLLLARSGATVGKTALIDEGAAECIAGAYFIRLRFSDAIRPLYAQMMLRSKPVQKIIAERSRQSAQQNFNGPAIRALPLPVPPKDLQDEFVAFHRKAVQVGKRLAGTTGQANDLFNSLVQRAFKGEL